MLPGTNLDELDQPVNVVEAKVERGDADGEVDVRGSRCLVVEYPEHVVR